MDTAGELAMDLVSNGLLSEEDREHITDIIEEQLRLVTWAGE